MYERDGSQHAVQQSYLLRLWRLGDAGPLRATVIAIGSHAPPRQFADVDRLVDFLLAEVFTKEPIYCTADSERSTYLTRPYADLK
jgi:hypothetical protein